jgi:hypothetical protein
MQQLPRGAGPILIGIALFLVTALLEGLITMFLFKKYGGCPMVNKHSKPKRRKNGNRR